MIRNPGRLRVGLLGGSFNPAHDGHLHISNLAIRRLGLDAVWWLVSPQNPLKPRRGMAPLADRMASATQIAGGNRRIHVTDLETRLGTVHTAKTIAKLRARYRRTRFVWIMGADNLATIHRWQHWPAIFRLVPVAVFSRSTYDSTALASKAARRFARFRVGYGTAANSGHTLADRCPPAWVFVTARRVDVSATRLRTEGKFAPAIAAGQA